MPSKAYNSNHLRRLSWPTVMNSNAFVCKSQTMINFSDQRAAEECRQVRLIKLNNHLYTSRSKPNSTLDNLFRSIRKRKLKHPINCFNRKNVKLQLFFTTCSANAQDYLHIINLNRSIRSQRNSSTTQSAVNLTDLDQLTSLNDSRPLNVQGQALRRSRSSVGGFEHLNMEWLRAIRNSIDSTSNRPQDDHSKPSFNNLIKLDFKTKDWKNCDTPNKELTKDCRTNDKSTDHKLADFKLPHHSTIERTRPEFKVDELFKEDLTANGLFNSNHLDTNEQINLENLIDEALSFPVGVWCKVDCEICFQDCWLHRRVCCDYAVCSNCLSQYFQERISLGSFSIECVNNRCHVPVNRNEISISLEPKYKEIYHNLLRVNNDLGKLTRTCPNCNFLCKLKDNSELKRMRKNRKKDPTVSRVKCKECEIDWCFLCHAPWHLNISCKKFIAGDRLLRDWAKQFNGGQVNAQKCPTCKAFIQRISGCDHMHCSNCDTDFCYKCGEKLRRLKFFGNHYSKLSVFGCKYRYKANQPALRKTIRFTVFCAKLAAAPVLSSAVVAAVGVALTVGIAALPVYALLRSARWIVEQRSFKSKRKNQTDTSNLRPILKSDIDSAILYTSSKMEDFNNQQYIQHFGISENSMHASTFTQNANWLANYGLMSDLNSASSTRFSGMDGLDSSTSDKGIQNYHIKRRKPQIIFKKLY